MFLLSIKFCGILKEYAQSDEIELASERNLSIDELKKKIIDYFCSHSHYHDIVSVIESSVVSNDTQVLSNQYVLDSNQSLAVLPPVCGG
jgi:molybdopterin converting factor small subunit